MMKIPDTAIRRLATVDFAGPSFPYRQIQFTGHGTAYYHDLGKSLPTLRNSFRDSGMVSLGRRIPAGTTPRNFRLEWKIITLVKPNPS